MRSWSHSPRTLPLLLAVLVTAAPLQAQITTPLQELGHNFGDDYFLANYRQIEAYWRKLAGESDRMVLREIGTTAEGRTQLMAIVTSPQNHAQLERYQTIARQMARAEIPEAAARQLAREGKAVVWIDGGLHASEVLGAQQLGETVYQLVSRNDPQTLNILENVIVLLVHANPDGNDLLADWYMRNPVPEQRSTGGVPKLYQKYIGHDNNRDFFASTQVETENMNRVLYHEWYPQIMYNHHQSGPSGTILWAPPLRDPYNYNLDPMILTGMQLVSAAMHTGLIAAGMPGSTMREGASYDGWWNGGIRNTTTFHNMIGLLTEMIGSPTPTRVPFQSSRQIPSSYLPMPVEPQVWHFRQSVDYSITLNYAVLDLAAKMRENFLFNIWRMGMNSIERGSQDTWTPSPRRLARMDSMISSGALAIPGGAAGDSARLAYLHSPELRDPRGYVIPSDQRDFPTATKFINALLEVGIDIQRATAEFTAQGKRYPAGSYVVKTAQAFRPHIIDMFEPQHHPDIIPYPGASPTRPYDNAGWTLAFQMGVQFDRILEDFSGPFEKISAWNIKPSVHRAPGSGSGAPAAYRLSHAQNDAFTAIARLQKAGYSVSWLQNGSGSAPAGDFLVPSRGASDSIFRQLGDDLGVDVWAAASAAPAGAWSLREPRVGLWDQYGGSMDAGWVRWILEQFEIPFTRVFPPRLDEGNLSAAFDALVFVEGGIPGGGAASGRGARGGGAGAGRGGRAGGAGGRGGRGGGGGGGGGTLDDSDLPAEYRGQRGSVSADVTIPLLKDFVENGGTIVAIGNSATNLARHFELGLENHLVDAQGNPLRSTDYFVPGSVLQARVDTTHYAAHGMLSRTDFFFSNSEVWKLPSDAAARGMRPIAWFDSATPLRSGWGLGQQNLEGGVIAVEARVGRGKLLLYGAEVLQRAQPHGTFKLLFNGIYSSAVR